jgi:ABC-type transport system involved in Fe-S cluster assembly fused permease/ATPase subunit
MAFITRARVELLTAPVLFNTRETVAVDTRARRATRSRLMKNHHLTCVVVSRLIPSPASDTLTAASM